MIRYLITTHDGLDGVRLSRLGEWGNVPFDSREHALAAAQRDSRGKEHKIEDKHFAAPREWTGRMEGHANIR